VPAARAFRPQVMLVSCGFDAHRDDPLAAMRVSGEGFRAMAAIVRALADDECEGRLAFVLEGGYAASGLQEGTEAVLDVLLRPDRPPLPKASDVGPGSPLERIVAGVVEVHSGRISDLGAA